MARTGEKIILPSLLKRTALIALLCFTAFAVGCSDEKASAPLSSAATADVAAWPDSAAPPVFSESARARRIPYKKFSMGPIFREGYILGPGSELTQKLSSHEKKGLTFEICVPLAGGSGEPSSLLSGLELEMAFPGEGKGIGSGNTFSIPPVQSGQCLAAGPFWLEDSTGKSGRPDSPAEFILSRPSLKAGEPELVAAISAPRLVDKKRKKPVIIIVSVDTLRPDHTSQGGYTRDTSPEMAVMAGNMAVFQNCFAHASWTPPSVASLFTSLYPTQHGSIGRDSLVLAEENMTMAEIFKQAGYATAAFSASPFIHPEFGFGQGFEVFGFDDTEYAPNLERMVMEWASDYRGGPLLLYVMFFDPHYPYEPRPPYKDKFSRAPDGSALWNEKKLIKLDTLFDVDASVGRDTYQMLKSRYNEEIACSSASVYGLFTRLKKSLDFDPELDILLVTSDHGEEFVEHGAYGHGNTLYNELLRVVLMIQAPGAAGGEKINEVVRHIDVLPTLLDFAGLPLVTDVEGQSLRPYFIDPSSEKDRPAYAVTRHLFEKDRSARSLIKGRYKLIVSENPSRVELYDLAADPGELRNLSRDRTEVLREMIEDLEKLEAVAAQKRIVKSGAPAPDRVDDLMKSLGYIGDEKPQRKKAGKTKEIRGGM